MDNFYCVVLQHGVKVVMFESAADAAVCDEDAPTDTGRETFRRGGNAARFQEMLSAAENN